jgi:hypothetical protein
MYSKFMQTSEQNRVFKLKNGIINFLPFFVIQRLIRNLTAKAMFQKSY